MLRRTRVDGKRSGATLAEHATAKLDPHAANKYLQPELLFNGVKALTVIHNFRSASAGNSWYGMTVWPMALLRCRTQH